MTDSELPMLFWRVKHKNALTLTVAARRASADGLLTESPISVLEVSSRTNRASFNVLRFQVSGPRCDEATCADQLLDKGPDLRSGHTQGWAAQLVGLPELLPHPSLLQVQRVQRQGLWQSGRDSDLALLLELFCFTLHHAGKRFFRKSSSD